MKFKVGEIYRLRHRLDLPLYKSTMKIDRINKNNIEYHYFDGFKLIQKINSMQKLFRKIKISTIDYLTNYYQKNKN